MLFPTRMTESRAAFTSTPITVTVKTLEAVSPSEFTVAVNFTSTSPNCLVTTPVFEITETRSERHSTVNSPRVVGKFMFLVTELAESPLA